MRTQADFWTWFTRHAGRLQTLDVREAVNEVHDEITQLDDRLGIEISTELTEAGRRELIITAYAQREGLKPAVALAAAAPEVPGWDIIGLRPPGGFDFSLENDDGGFKAEDLRFVPKAEGGEISVDLVIPATTNGMNGNEREQLGWQMLNAGLGERLAARIGTLNVISFSPSGRPIAELAPWLETNAPPVV